MAALQTRRWVGVVACVVLAAVAAGCGGSDDDVDGAASDGAGPDGPAVTAPDVPWLADGYPPIMLTPCPDGWREVPEASGLVTCDPYPESGPLDCPDGEAHFTGEPGCVSVGSACPAGDFSEMLPADTRIVYVQPGATGGDGASPATPYGSIMDFSFGGLPLGAVVALSRGAHTGPVRLARNIVLQGACSAATVLSTAVPAETEGVVTVRDGGELRDLTVASSPRPGVWVRGPGFEATLRGVVVSDTESSAIDVTEGARLTAHETIVRATRSRRSDGNGGWGLYVDRDATAELSRALFSENRELGVVVATGSGATLSDLAVRDTLSAEASGTDGRGLNVQGGATADVSRASFSANRDIGIVAFSADSALTLSDVVVRDTEAQEGDGLGGLGLQVQEGAAAEASRLLVANNREIGVYANGEGSTLALSEMLVRGTRSSVDGTGGRGLNAQLGARAEVQRALIIANHDVGVFVGGADTTMTLSDVAIRETRGRTLDEADGGGLIVQVGPTAEVSRALVQSNTSFGVVVSGEDVAATLSDVVVRDTQSRASDGSLGRALSIQIGATATVTRAVLAGNRDLSVLVGGAMATATLSDIAIRDTSPPTCAETTCADAPSGHGLGSVLGAAASMTRFRLERSSMCGALLARDGQLDLTEGEVRENTIGVCVQNDGYDTNRLTRDVRFVDNELNLQATALPVPEPVAPIEVQE